MLENKCLVCQSRYTANFSWAKLLSFRLFQADPLLNMEEWLCPQCRQELEWIERDKACQRCSRSLAQLNARYVLPEENGHICYDCHRWLAWEAHLKISPLLTWNKSIVTYNEWVKEQLIQYKFRGDERLKYFFAALLFAHPLDPLARSPLLTGNQFDLVTTIPLAQERIAERGFNQTEPLAASVAARLNIQFVSLLARQNDGAKQSKKSREERLEHMLHKFLNISGGFDDILRKNILIVDDVYTTGATVHAAAYVLKQNGAGRVCSLTVAR